MSGAYMKKHGIHDWYDKLTSSIQQYLRIHKSLIWGQILNENDARWLVATEPKKNTMMSWIQLLFLEMQYCHISE